VTYVSAPRSAPAVPADRRVDGWPHLIWEGALLVLVLVAAVVLYAQDGLRAVPLSYSIASTGLFATAFALSLRTATPNLAVIGVGSLAGMTYGEVLGAGAPAVVAAAAALLVALLLGAGMGVVTGLLNAPAWAVSLGGLALAQAVTFAVTNGASQRLPRDELIRSGSAGTAWLLLFLILSIGGAVLWAVPAVRAALGANQPAPSFGARLVGAIAGLGGSSLIAGAAGILLTGRFGAWTPAFDAGQLVLVVGAVLLGGVSVLGGRGGYAGTALAVILLVLIQTNLVVADGPRWTTTVLAALAILAGVVISRLFDLIRTRMTRSQPVPPPGFTGAVPDYSDSAGNRS
jgi:ribose/xylose/arabinose/galactoside ABC-type transport system permease subunit